MSLRQSTSNGRVFLACLIFVTTFALLAHAQDETPPKADLFLGYQWLDPGGDAPSFAPGVGGGPVQTSRLPSFAHGFGAAVGYNFHPNVAAEADLGASYHSPGMSIYTASVGPRFTWRSEGINLFAHALVGLNRLELPNFGSHNQIGGILGGGIDLGVTHGLSIRLIEADYQVVQDNFSKQLPATDPNRHSTLNGVRLRTGLVFNFGGGPTTPPAASCSVQPQEVMVGEPVTVSATGSNFNPKHTLSYNWSSTGGKVSGKDNAATVDTTGLAGGSYTATARVSDPKMKKGGEASCNANFTVKEPPKNPPTMSCTANPTSLQAGGTVTVTCDCKSPDNVPVSVAGWNASAGQVQGSGNTGTLNTTGAQAGPITVSATCTDSRGLNASSNTQVNVETPPPPPPQSSKLSECTFPNKAKPWRVDNTCKAVLDDVAQALKNQADAKVVIVGFADPDELKKRKNLAGERAVDAKAYLSGGEAKQGIDPSRLEVRTGSGGGQKTEYWLVPAGANFTEGDTQPVDESKVKAIPDHPKPAAKKRAKKTQ
jgi:outer membrane protein OmpA-like peptidoglycan-associated protein